MDSSNQNEIVRVKLDSLAHGGTCIGEIQDEGDKKGLKVFVPFTIPGEVADVKITKQHDTYLEGSLEKIITKSEDRKEAPCPYFQKCGGCDLQHMNVAAQRKAKREMVENMIERHGGTKATKGVTLLGGDLPEFNYRRRITLHLRAGKIGFYRKQTADTVEIDNCMITEEVVNKELAKMIPILKAYSGGPRRGPEDPRREDKYTSREKGSKSIRPCPQTENSSQREGYPPVRGDLIIEQHGGEAHVIIRMLVKYKKGRKPRFSEELLEELKKNIANIKVHLSKHILLHQIGFKDVSELEPSSLPIGHFSQVNDAANQYLIDTVLDSIDRKEVTELYAGSGNFSLALAKQGKKVDAVEVDKKLVRHGIALSKEEYLDELVEFYRMTSEKYVEKHDVKECLILDPPRSGAAFAAESMGRHTNTKKIVYISCYMPTLCRDIKTLVGHGFELEETFVVDMFPQTHHVETISILTRS